MSNVQELNTLELFFLDLLDWKVNVSTEEYFDYSNKLTNYFSTPIPKLSKDVFDDIQKAISKIETMYEPGS